VEVRGSVLTETRLDPAAFGVPRATLDALRGGDARRNAELARAMLAGTRSPLRDIILVNAGCAIYVADQARTVPEGLAKADEALASGRALTLLERVKELSRHAG